MLSYKKYLFILCIILKTSPSLLAKTLPQRIISTSVAGDELLLSLLKSPEKRKRLLALSTLADNPQFSSLSKEARSVPHRVGANIEQILSLKPDLIIAASFNQPEFISVLRKMKWKVHIMEGFQSLEDLKRHIHDLGSLVGAEEESQILVETMKKDILEFKNLNLGAKKVLPILADRTLLGKDTLLDDLLSSVGFTNLARNLGVKGWQKISEEKLLQMSPDWIITSAEESEREHVYQTLSKSPALRRMKAFDKKKLILIRPSIWSSFSPEFLEILKKINIQRF